MRRFAFCMPYAACYARPPPRRSIGCGLRMGLARRKDAFADGDRRRREKSCHTCHYPPCSFFPMSFFPSFHQKLSSSALLCPAGAGRRPRAKKVLTDDLANNHILDSEQNQSSNDHGSNSMNLCNCLFESTFQFGFDTSRLHHKYFTVCFFLAFVIHKGYVHLQKECHHLFFLQPSDVSFRLLRLVRFERKAMTALVLVRVGGSSRVFRNRRGYRLRRGQCPSIPT